MNKSDIILRICDSSPRLEDEGATLDVTAWGLDTSCMIDEHVIGYFNELKELGLEEIAEGQMLHYGDYRLEDMIKVLKDHGFHVEELNTDKTWVKEGK